MKKKKIKNNKKAVSPVVATILLIMITIIIAIIIIIAFSYIIKEAVIKQVGDQKKRAEDACRDISIKPVLNSDGTFGIRNDGNIPIAKIELRTSLGGSISSSQLDVSVAPGGIQMVQNELRGSYDEVTIVPIILGKTKSNLPKYFTCPEEYGVKI